LIVKPHNVIAFWHNLIDGFISFFR